MEELIVKSISENLKISQKQTLAVLSMLEEVFSSGEITSIVLNADDDSLLADYSEYAINHLEQYIQDDVVLTSIVLRNDRFTTTDNEENE